MKKNSNVICIIISGVAFILASLIFISVLNESEYSDFYYRVSQSVPFLFIGAFVTTGIFFYVIAVVDTEKMEYPYDYRKTLPAISFSEGVSLYTKVRILKNDGSVLCNNCLKSQAVVHVFFIHKETRETYSGEPLCRDSKCLKETQEYIDGTQVSYNKNLCRLEESW
ncbi:MAG: hypothetical protein ACI8V7_000485 [Candidatus Paceibacteria bacterium]|jgi:hypothetical protein